MVTRAQISLVKCRNRVQCCNKYQQIEEHQDALKKILQRLHMHVGIK